MNFQSRVNTPEMKLRLVITVINYSAVRLRSLTRTCLWPSSCEHSRWMDNAAAHYRVKLLNTFNAFNDDEGSHSAFTFSQPQFWHRETSRREIIKAVKFHNWTRLVCCLFAICESLKANNCSSSVVLVASAQLCISLLCKTSPMILIEWGSEFFEWEVADLVTVEDIDEILIKTLQRLDHLVWHFPLDRVDRHN